MANFPGLTLTDAGKTLQAKAQTGQALKFTRVALGDGAPPASIAALTGLVAERQALSIQRQDAPGDGTATLRVIMTNKGVSTGFYMRELGVFAADPDTGVEMLYSYSNAGDETDFLPAEGGAVVWEGVFDVITIVGNADNVTAVIDDYITIALKSEVDALRPYVLPEGGTVGQIAEKASNAEGDTRWIDPKTDGIRINFTSVEEPRTAVANQRVFTLQKTVTNGLAVYVNGKRLSREAWATLSATQLQLVEPLAAGTSVLFVNNEEAGAARALGVSLSGPTLVYAGSSNAYTLTDFDAFSKYTVSTTQGTLTRDAATLTLDVPTEATGDTLDIEIVRDNVRSTFRVAVGDAAILAPELTYPTSGATDVDFEPDITTAPFVVYPEGYDNHVETRWQVARDTTFTDLVFDHQDAKNLTAISLATQGVRLDPATRYYVRAQYVGASLTSGWSGVVSFNTATVYIRRPAIISPADGQEGVSTGLTLSSDAFSIYGGDDAHQSTRWQIANDADFSSIVIDSGWSTSQLLSYAPSGIAALTEYFVRVKYKGDALGESEWSRAISFITAQELTGQFTTLAGGATARRYPILGESDGKLYLYGGYGSAVALNDMWAYDPGTDEWTQLEQSGDMPPAGLYRSGSCVLDGKLYLFGGIIGTGSYTNYLYCCTLATVAWEKLEPTGAVLRALYGSSMVALGGKIYIAGGSTGVEYAYTWAYDPATNVVTALASMPEGVYHKPAVVIDGLIYVVGGMGGNTSLLYVYDPSIDRWSTKTPTNGAGYLWDIGVTIGGKIYRYGGGSITRLYEYDPAVNTWELVAEPPTSLYRWYSSAAVIGGAMYVYGGYNTSTRADTNQLFRIN